MAIKSLSHSSLTDNLFYRSMLVGNTAYQPSDEDILAETILTSSQGSVTFTGLNTLAADYKHLQIRATLRSTRADTDSYAYIRFNSDTGSNYTTHYLRGTGSGVDSGNLTSVYPNGVQIYTGIPASTNTANSFGANIIDILDFSDTTKNTTVRILNGFAGSFSRVGLQGGAWLNTNAVTSITLSDYFGSFAQYSSFTLIGVK